MRSPRSPLSPVALISRLPDLAARHPTKVFIGLGLITILAVMALPGLKLQRGIYELFPSRPGPITDLATIGKVFHGRHEVIALVSGTRADSVIRATRQLASRLSGSPLIRDVRAAIETKELVRSIGPSMLLLAGQGPWHEIQQRLTTRLSDRVARLRRLLLSPLTPSRRGLQQDPLGLVEVLLQNLGHQRVDRRTGLFTNRQGTAALLFVRPRADPDDLDACAQLHRALHLQGEEVVASIPGVQVQFTGAHLYAHQMSRLLKRDLTLSSVAALCGAVAVLMLFFRSLRLIPMAGLISVLAVIWTLAVAVAASGELNVISLSFAALCIGLGMDALIHITARAQQTGRLDTALRAVMPSLLAAAATTIAAFAAFSWSTFAGLAQTGGLAACGLTLTLILTLVLTPALGRSVPRPTIPVLDEALGRLANGVQRCRWLTLSVGVVLGAAAGVSALHLGFSTDLTRLAPEDIPPARTDRAIARHFSRARSRWIILLEGSSSQQVLQVNDRLADRLERLLESRRIAGYSSLSVLLPARQTQRARRERLLGLNPRRLVQNLKDALESAGLEPEAFSAFYRSLTDPRELTLEDLPPSVSPLVGQQLAVSRDRTLVATMLHPLPDADPATLGRSLQSLATDGVTLRLTGADLAGAQMAVLLRGDLLLISGLCLVVVLIVLSLLLRDARPVAACLASLVVSAAVFVGCLTWLGLDVDLYNLMVLPLIIGYGVDDHIYVVRRAVVDGIATAVTTSGRAVLTTTLTSMAAFGALGICSLPGLRTLGLTAAVGLAVGLIGSLVLLPALLATLCPAVRTGYNAAS